MASLSLSDPSLTATVSAAACNEIITDVESEEYRDDLASFVTRLQETWKWPPVLIRIENGLPIHTGFGSKTTTLLAIGKAYAALQGQSVSTSDLAVLAGRGGTSGASVNLIDRGGYLVDGGHANPDDFAQDPQKYLLPSRFAQAAVKPPPLINLEFPSWPILLIVTEGTKLHGQPELEWFRKTLPIPAEEARRTAHHVLMHLSPAIAEADYGAFCRAVNVLTYEHHYKREQIAIQPEPIRRMFDEARCRDDIDAICISVTGPMCYVFTRRPREALQWCERLRSEGVVRWFRFSSANNRPCSIEPVSIT